jgi:hypothetical protein
VKCPTCRKELGKPEKTWKYRDFRVEAYRCGCGTGFREYTLKGKHSFFLKKSKKDKKYIKP